MFKLGGAGGTLLLRTVGRVRLSWGTHSSPFPAHLRHILSPGGVSHLILALRQFEHAPILRLGAAGPNGHDNYKRNRQCERSLTCV